MPRKGTGLQLSINEYDKELLEEIAANLGFVRGTKPNITGLVEAIARKQLVLSTGKTLTQFEQETLTEAVLRFQETAKFKEARALIAIAKNNFAIEAQYLQQLNNTLSEVMQPWLIELEECIRKQQPFQLSYQDAAERVWTYTVHYAEIVFREKRNYLECWCEESDGNQDIPELCHNWSLRLDRISEPGLVPIKGKWRSSLDTIEVEFELLGGLAHAYREREHDIQVEWQSVDPPIKRVVRQIFNTFWFVREILPYGKDCVVRSPEPVRRMVLEHYSEAQKRYEH